MKTAALLLVALALLPAGFALAHPHESTVGISNVSCCDPPARWGPRHDARDVELAITTEDGDATLMLTRSLVALQLSDRTFHKVDRKLKHERDQEEEGVVAQAIKDLVLGGVRALLDHSAECPLGELRDAEVRGGGLVLTTEDGRHLFEGISVSDSDVLRGFRERDAQRFVREFHRLRHRGD